MKSPENKIGHANGVAATKGAAAPNALNLKTREQREKEAIEAMRVVTGTRSDHAADRLTIQACHALVWPPVHNDAAIVEGVAAMAEMAPRTGTEGMLAVQMIAAHNAALMFLNRATIKEQHPEAIDSNVIRATRLMRLFLEQVEALQKLQGKTGQQKVVVEHVHVNEGGQAIVGAVSATNGEGEISDAGAWTSCEAKRMAESTAIRPEISLRRRVVARRPGAGHLVWALPCTTAVAGCMGGRARGRRRRKGWRARGRQRSMAGTRIAPKRSARHIGF